MFTVINRKTRDSNDFLYRDELFKHLEKIARGRKHVTRTPHYWIIDDVRYDITSIDHYETMEDFINSNPTIHDDDLPDAEQGVVIMERDYPGITNVMEAFNCTFNRALRFLEG